MGRWEKLQTVFILAAVGLGLLLGQWETVSQRAAPLVAPCLTAMLFGLFLGVPLKDLAKSFFNAKFALTSLIINFLWIPVLGWLLGGLFLADHPALRLGFVMLLVTPCTDWYLVFTALAGGNVTLSAAILPLNLVFQVALLPVYLLLFAGLTGQVEPGSLLLSILTVLVLPFGLAQLVRRFWPDESSPVRRVLAGIFTDRQFVFLCLAITAMFASQAGHLAGRLDVFWLLLQPVALFFILNFLVGRLVARLLGFNHPDSVSLSLTTLARNSPVALAIAVTAFPGEPLVALALVIGPLIELPFLAVITQVLKWLQPAADKLRPLL